MWLCWFSRRSAISFSVMRSMTSSFEILPSGSDPNPENQEDLPSSEFYIFPNPVVGGMSNPANENSTYSTIVSLPQLSAEQMCEQLQQLLGENMNLKEKLQKNNSIMREQLTTIAAWHEQMEVTNSKHRAVLKEALKAKDELESENKLLKGSLLKEQEEKSKPCTQCQDLTQLIEKQKEDMHIVSLEKNELFGELLKVEANKRELEENVQKITQQLDSLDFINTMLDNEKKELTALNVQLNTEIQRLKPDSVLKTTTIVSDDDSDYAIVIQEPIQKHAEEVVNDALKTALLEVDDLNLKVNNLNQQLDEERKKFTNMSKAFDSREEEIKLLRESFEELSALCKENEELKTLVDELKEKLNNTIQSLAETQKNYELVTVECDNCKTKLNKVQEEKAAQIQHLQGNITELEQSLSNEKSENESARSILKDAEEQRCSAIKNYEELANILAIKEQEAIDQQEQAKTIKEIEERKSLEQLDVLTAKFLNAEQQLKEQKQLVENLRKEILMLKDESECIPVLKAQVEVYKIDFNKEKAACDSAKAEVQRLSETVKTLQTQQEINSPRARHYKSSRNHSSGHRKSGSNSSSSEKLYECPSCFFKFSSLLALENHVESCLDGNILVS